MAFDEKNGVAVLFGGYFNSYQTHLNDTWTYDVAANTWTELNTPVALSERHWTGMAYDKNNEVIMAFSGHVPDDDITIDELEMPRDTWILDVANETWTEVSPALQPAPRQGNLIYNDNDGLFYHFGGKYEINQSA